MELGKEIAKKIATDFYYWWANQPGSNTLEGFDSFWNQYSLADLNKSPSESACYSVNTDKPDIRELIEKAAGELPRGAIVYIGTENGAAYIEAQNINDQTFDLDASDMTLEEQFIEAVQWCKDTTE